MKVCVVGASEKLGNYMVQHALDRGYEVVGVCREGSVSKLDPFKERITIIQGPTNDREVIKRAVDRCDGVLTVLVPWGVQQYSTGTARCPITTFTTGGLSSNGTETYYKRNLGQRFDRVHRTRPALRVRQVGASVTTTPTPPAERPGPWVRAVRPPSRIDG